jgi:hypothetical protein
MDYLPGRTFPRPSLHRHSRWFNALSLQQQEHEMKPLVQVQRIAQDAYVYRVSITGARAAGDSGTFESLEHCLFDAGASLDQYFSSVELNLDGLFIGQYPTGVLRRHPSVVAQRILQHFRPFRGAPARTAS